MSQTPLKETGSKTYEDAWRAINLLIRSDGSWSGRERNICYRNKGSSFENVSFITGLDFNDDGRAFATWDMDSDGDLDLLLKFRTGPQLRLMRNDFTGSPRALSIELQGTKSNADGIGALATLRTSNGTRVQEVRAGSGFLSQSSRRLHFGLSHEEHVVSLEIRWPSGHVDRHKGRLQPGLHRFTEAAGFAPIRVIPNQFSAAPPAAARRLERGTWLLERLPAPSLPAEIAQARGKTILVNFWAEWCPPCRAELADLSTNAAKLKEEGIEVLAVAVDDYKKTKLPFQTIRADQRTIEIWSTLNRYLSDRRRDLGLPTSFLIDEEGRIAKIYRGATTAEQIMRDVRDPPSDLLPFAGAWYAYKPTRNYNELATAMAEHGIHSEARMLFETAIEKRQVTHELLNNYAGLLVSTGDFERAATVLQTVVQQAPNEPAGRLNLGRVFAELGRRDAAIEQVKQALELQPDDGSAWATLAALYVSERRHAEALEAYDSALQHSGERADLLNEAGVIRAQMGDTSAAKRAFERAVAADPRDPASRLNLALLHLQTGDAASARTALEPARKLGANNSMLLLLDAQILLAEGKIPEARSAAEELLRLDPQSSQARELLRRIPKQ